MKLLHITPHLGGGIGKALSTLSLLMPKEVEQTFLLLEKPINQQYVDVIVKDGHKVVVSEGLDHVARLAKAADIVQFEFINHPRLFECLARTKFPAIRSVIWAHISGLYKPYIHPGLIEQAQRFVFTSKASLKSPALGALAEKAYVINSGFGLKPKAPDNIRAIPVIGYLGTVNFVKLHKGFFEAVDKLDHNVEVLIYGIIDPVVVEHAMTMRNPERFNFCGETFDPAEALSTMDIFFYPLQPEHYGTGENALIEAMSAGMPVVVMNNPAENEIVIHRRTGFIADSAYNCTVYLDRLMRSRSLRTTMGDNAAKFAAIMRSPEESLARLMVLWEGLLSEEPKRVNFGAAIGTTPADWYLATQRLPGMVYEPIKPDGLGASKGSLAHFKKIFVGDKSFAALG